MTDEDAYKTLRAGEKHIGGNIGARIVPYACPGGFAVVAPVAGQDDLWYVLTEYHPNVFEDLEAIAAAPPVMRLFPDTITAFRWPLDHTAGR